MSSPISTLVAVAMVTCGATYGFKNSDQVARAFPEFARYVTHAKSTLIDTEPAKHDDGHSGEPGAVELSAGPGGHFETDAEVNGRPIGVMVDTGATIVALTYEDAESAGIFLKPSDFTMRVSTANGVGKVAPVTLSRVSIGGITVRNVNAAVAEPGRLHKTLLGMSFLGRLSRVDMRAGTLVLHD